MARSVLLTGASGALGPHLLFELLRCNGVERVFVLLRRSRQPLQHRVDQLHQAIRILAAGAEDDLLVSWDRVVPIAVDIRQTDLAIEGDASDRLRTVDTIIHAAANTCFTAPPSDLFDVNVVGTRNLLAFARRCPRLQQFIFVSTTCVAGTRTGVIAERLDEAPPAFVNEYERTKWQAEQLVAKAEIPARIVRLSHLSGRPPDRIRSSIRSHSPLPALADAWARPNDARDANVACGRDRQRRCVLAGSRDRWIVTVRHWRCVIWPPVSGLFRWPTCWTTQSSISRTRCPHGVDDRSKRR